MGSRQLCPEEEAGVQRRLVKDAITVTSDSTVEQGSTPCSPNLAYAAPLHLSCDIKCGSLMSCCFQT